VVAAESGAVSEVAERAAHAVKLANQALESAAVLANEFEARLRALDARLDGALAHAGAAASTSAERARAREQADAALAHAGALRADLDALRERVQRQEQALAALEGQGTQLAEATRHERDVGNRLDALEAGITTVSEALREQDRLAATVRGEQEELARRHRDDLARLSETLREALLARDDQRARESAAAGAATAERLELTEARLGHLEGRLGALIAAQRPEAEAPRRPSPALDVYATAARAAVGRILLVLLSTLRALVPAPPAGPASKPTR
jgi:chromosome segregation ATPase